MLTKATPYTRLRTQLRKDDGQLKVYHTDLNVYLSHGSGIKPLCTCADLWYFLSLILVLKFCDKKKKVSANNLPTVSACELRMWTTIKICYFPRWWLTGVTAVCMRNTSREKNFFPLDASHWQQGLKLKIGIHHLMASIEWALSDDWKLRHDARWGSCMNPPRVLRSAAFNTMPREKLFAQFESFSCRFCYLQM